jgi:hypothetical protein
MKYKAYLFAIIATSIVGCSTPKENVMPFVNFGYAGERLFPVSENDAEFTFRAWVSLSTTIDRVFSISYDKDLDYAGRLLEIRGRSLNQKIKDKTTFKELNITPRSGFEKFISKVDSLHLLELKDQPDSNFQIALHEPIALYVIEIKSHGKFNHFKFRTHLVNKEKVEEKYHKIQELILKELPFKFYMNDK